MTETWCVDGDGDPVSAVEVTDLLRARMAAGQLETWLTGSSGRSLAWISNTERVLVMLLDDADDPGEHAVDASATGVSGGFVLANGQTDAYPDADTVPLADAFRIVRHLLGTGAPPAGTAWVVDR